MVSYAWGGHSNGYIPQSALRYTSGGWLRADAANAFDLMAKAFKRRFGKNLTMSEGYRDFATQIQMKAYWTAQGKPGNAAAPGGSIHGWALAVDIDLTGLTQEQINWLHSEGRAFGYNWDSTGRPTGEPWHLDFNLPVTAVDEDDEIEKLKEAIVAITAIGAIENTNTKGIAIFGDVRNGFVEIAPADRTRYNALKVVLNQLAVDAGYKPVLPDIPLQVDDIGWENIKFFYQKS